MLSLEEQIGRVADSAVEALDAVTVVPAGQGGRRSGRPVIVWAALAAAASVALVVVISNRAPDKAVDSVGTLSVTTTPGGSSTVPVTPGLPDSQPVTVTGTRLPVFDDKLTSDPAVERTAPVINGSDFQGNPITIDGSASGPMLVVFLAPWSPHSSSQMTSLIEWKRNGRVPASLNVVGVVSAVSKNIGDPPASWLSSKGWDWPVMIDQSKGEGVAGVAAEAYGANGFPYMVLVGSDGEVKLRLSGEVPIADLQHGIDTALTATAISTPST
jgi:hypothetical protein